MLLVVANAVVFAIFIVIVLVPALFIYDPDKHPGESLGPPPAGSIISKGNITHAVRQKLYLLFMIPACTVVNMLWLYFTHYRPLRMALYTTEANIISLHMNRLAGLQQLSSASIADFGNTVKNTSMIRGKTFYEAGRSGAVDADIAPSAGQTTLRRHARPTMVTVDMEVKTPFPELRRLINTITEKIIEPCQESEKRFGQSVERAVGYFDSFAPQNGTYTSRHVPQVNMPAAASPDSKVQRGIDLQHTVVLVPSETPRAGL